MTFVQGTEVIGGAAAEGEAHGAGLRGKGRHLHLGWIFWLCVAWLAGLAIAAAAAPVLPLSNPLATDIANRLISPDANFWLGTDQLGRDMLSRLLDGARISVLVAFVVQIVIILIGVPVGAIAGWFGNRTDNFLMRLTDVIYAFPDLLFIILLSVAFRETPFGQALDGLFLVFVAIGLVGWVTVARLTRGQMLSLRETEFVEAAQALGVPDRKIVMKHLLPNGISPIIVAITLGVPTAILAEATLAYIGIGVQPPRASWGSLIADGQKYVRGEPHLVVLPAVAIALALIGFTFLGDGLRDALDPKLKGKQ